MIRAVSSRIFRAFAALLFFVSLAFAAPSVVWAQGATIAGSVVDLQGGLPIPGARVELLAAEKTVAQMATNAAGIYAFTNVSPGHYAVIATNANYQSSRSSDVVVSGSDTRVTTDFVLQRASAAQATTVIGRASTAATNRAALQTTTTITHAVSPDTLQSEGFNRIGEGLGLLPGVNLRGQNANTGDDLYVDIRGLKPSETQTLLDGHPIGPIGVNSSTTSGGYDYMASPLVGLRNIQVTYGSGALGLYGTDSAGGTIDWQTLEPTRKPTGSLAQSLGSIGHSSTTAVASSSYGPLGVVVALGVLGTRGLFDGSPQLQSGLLGTNLTSANIAKNTYPVSGDTLLRNAMAKVRLNFSPVSQLTLTELSVGATEDKTGTGNNYTPYATQLYLTQLKGLGAIGSACPSRVQVTTDAGKSCLSPTAYANIVSGPAGTGAGRVTSTADQDFHARFSSQLLGGALAVDAFESVYQYNNPTPVSQTTVVPTFATDRYTTFGFLASDDYQSAKNDFGFGWYVQHQRYNGIRNAVSTPTIAANTPVASIATGNLFIRDVFTPSRQLQLFLNAWLKNSTSSEVDVRSIDPRLSVVYRPNAASVFRVTGGRSVGLPDPAQAIGSGFTNAGSLNPQCANLRPGVGGIGVGTPGVHGLQPETATDYEVAAGHRFSNSTTFDATYYDSAVRNLLFPTTINASLYPAGTISAAVLGNVDSGIFNRVYNASASCKALLNPANPQSLIPYLAFTVPTNAANGLFRGIDLTLHQRLSREVSLTATWDVQSSIETDIPVSLLKQNVYLINNSQLFGIPLQKQGLELDYESHGFAAHLDATRIGKYNQFDAPPFCVFNGYVSQRLPSRMTLALGATNIFDTRNFECAQTGAGLYVAENRFGTDTTGFTQSATYNKLRSYQPRQVVFTLSQRY